MSPSCDVEVGVGRVRMPGRRLEALLRSRARVAAREVAELELLLLSEGLALQIAPSRARRWWLVDVEVEQVAALRVEALERRLHVEEKAREVLEQAHVALDDEDLLRERGVAGPRLDVAGDRVARGVAPAASGAKPDA